MDQSSGGTPVSEHACTECRRRKARCDKTDPCSNCAKYQRTCSYARQPRTPLTRRHLSEVERELARTKELLRSASQNDSVSAGEPYDGLADIRGPISPAAAYDIASQTSYHPGPSRNAVDRDGNERIEQLARPTVASTTMTMSRPGPDSRITGHHRLLSGASSTEHHQLMVSLIPTCVHEEAVRGPKSNGTKLNEQRMQAPDSATSAPSQRNGQKGSPAFSFETPPASGDFDWVSHLTKTTYACLKWLLTGSTLWRL